MSKIRVAVIFGGKSNEHDVSVVSATHVIKSIPKDKYRNNKKRSLDEIYRRC